MENPELRKTGGCFCGAVRYEIAEEATTGVNCHCLRCQKLSGAGHAFHVVVREAAFALTGEVKGYATPANSGNLVTTYFCPECGSQLFGRSSKYPGSVILRGASLDRPPAVSPSMSMFTARLQPWDFLAPSLPAFPGQPGRSEPAAA